MMKNSQSDEMKQWVESWARAGIALKPIKRKELQAADYARNLPVIDEMLQWACDHKKTRLSTGLVEQQRLFMKANKSDMISTKIGH